MRPLTFETKFLRTVLQQGVRRFPVNLRPVLGITKEHSSKGMGFLARGFMRLHKTTGDQVWKDKAEFALQWLVENRLPGYSGACWGNHFDYQSRGFYLPKRVTHSGVDLINRACFPGCLRSFSRGPLSSDRRERVRAHCPRPWHLCVMAKGSVSATFRSKKPKSTTPTHWGRACWPGLIRTRVTNPIGSWHRRRCSTRRNIKDPIHPGTMPRRQISLGRQLSYGVCSRLFQALPAKHG